MSSQHTFEGCHVFCADLGFEEKYAYVAVLPCFLIAGSCPEFQMSWAWVCGWVCHEEPLEIFVHVLWGKQLTEDHVIPEGQG